MKIATKTTLEMFFVVEVFELKQMAICSSTLSFTRWQHDFVVSSVQVVGKGSPFGKRGKHGTRFLLFRQHLYYVGQQWPLRLQIDNTSYCLKKRTNLWNKIENIRLFYSNFCVDLARKKTFYVLLQVLRMTPATGHV